MKKFLLLLITLLLTVPSSLAAITFSNITGSAACYSESGTGCPLGNLIDGNIDENSNWATMGSGSGTYVTLRLPSVMDVGSCRIKVHGNEANRRFVFYFSNTTSGAHEHSQTMPTKGTWYTTEFGVGNETGWLVVKEDGGLWFSATELECTQRSAPAPSCGWKDFYTTNESVAPFHVNVDDNSTDAATYEWEMMYTGFGTVSYSTNVSFLDKDVNYPGTYTIIHTIHNGIYSDTCANIQFYAKQNNQTPIVNITSNITPPNYTPILPTLPVTIPTLPDSMNRSNVRGLINGTILGNASASYISWWDTMTDGLVSFFSLLIDTFLSPALILQNTLELPTTWLTLITDQYILATGNILKIITDSMWAFPPKLANLVTYSLLLDCVLVAWHELQAKK